MESYVGKKRPLLVFAPEPDSLVARNQRIALAGAGQDFRDRDMVHVEVLGDAVWIDLAKSSSADADQLRARYRISESEKAVLLVGKDGGVKLRSDRVIEPHDLYGLIDTMPLRQREMRQGGASQ